MAQFHRIKILKEKEGLSERQIPLKLGISRNTISKYIKQDIPPNVIHNRGTADIFIKLVAHQ